MPPPDPASFRATMALLPTGVTVVSASTLDGPAGATANAVCSLSIEPMLILACLDRGSRTLLAVQSANRFGISVLRSGQEQLARSFATKAPVAEKWAGVAWSNRGGIPAIDHSLVWLACELRDVIAAGRPRDRHRRSDRNGSRRRRSAALSRGQLPSPGPKRLII